MDANERKRLEAMIGAVTVGGMYHEIIKWSQAEDGNQIRFSMLEGYGPPKGKIDDVSSALRIAFMNREGEDVRKWIRVMTSEGEAGWIEAKEYREVKFAGVVFVASMAKDFEESLKEGYLVVIRNNEVDRVIIFYCPCGCGARVTLSLKTPIITSAEGETWELDKHEDDTITLRPSVVVTSCGSHFKIIRSCVLV